jgi:hypothetical protein
MAHPEMIDRMMDIFFDDMTTEDKKMMAEMIPVGKRYRNRPGHTEKTLCER